MLGGASGQASSGAGVKNHVSGQVTVISTHLSTVRMPLVTRRTYCSVPPDTRGVTVSEPSIGTCQLVPGLPSSLMRVIEAEMPPLADQNSRTVSLGPTSVGKAVK